MTKVGGRMSQEEEAQKQRLQDGAGLQCVQGHDLSQHGWTAGIS